MVTHQTSSVRTSTAAQEAPLPEIIVWRPLREPFERWPHFTDLLIALLSFLLNLLMWSQDGETDALAMASLADIGAYLCVFVGNFALLWRRSHSWQVHAVILSISTLLFLTAPPDGIVALAFSLYSLGRYEASRRASIAGVFAALAFVTLSIEAFDTPSAGRTIVVMLVAGLWYLGRRLRFRGEYLRLLEERAQYLERERTAESERAVAAERTRIAREMHDIVAHQVSLMTVQAGAARTIGQSDPEAAFDAMASVETAGRQALSEMRHLLEALRPASNGNGTEDTLQPQPIISDLPKLVAQVSEVGLTVQLQTRGNLSGLPARLELTTYRIVQEALTNIIKHVGPSACVSITIEGHSKEIVITIKDNGKSSPAAYGSGHGIIGMSERVQLLGGSFKAGSVFDGGFEVCAVLPRKSGRS